MRRPCTIAALVGLLACAACGRVATEATPTDAGLDVRIEMAADAAERSADSHVQDVAIDRTVDAPRVDAPVPSIDAHHGDDAPRETQGVDVGTPEASPPDVLTMCIAACQTDVQCQSTCPAVPGTIQCCDPSAGACFHTALPACHELDASPPPPLCTNQCTADSDCQTACAAPAGLVMCCDTATQQCVPATSCPAQACTPPGTPIGFPCFWEPNADSVCASACMADSGLTGCCYPGSGVCYVSPTPECPQ